MDLTRTPLFGVGESYTFTTGAGQRGAVIVHSDGRRDIVVYDSSDHEQVLHTLVLQGTEPRTLAELLGLPLVMDRLTELTSPLDGVETVRMPIPAGSPYLGRRLGDTRARTRTGASIVAVIRSEQVISSPDPHFAFRRGDCVVAVGDRAGLTALREVFASG